MEKGARQPMNLRTYKKNTKVTKKPVNEKSNQSQEHKCNLCNFDGKTQVILHKHMNTKHCGNESNNE